MLKTITRSPLARIGLVAGLLLGGAAASSAAPLAVVAPTVLTSASSAAAPTEIRYVRHYRSRSGGRAFAGAALGLFGLGIGAAIANSRYDNYPSYGYYSPGYYPYYGYAPAYSYPRHRYAPYRGREWGQQLYLR